MIPDRCISHVTGPYKWQLNIGVGNEFVPSGNRSLLETMLNEIYVAMWRH